MQRHPFLHVFLAVAGCVVAMGFPATAEEIETMPAGYQLQICDDCGVLERQPHVKGSQVHTFGPDEVDADEKARSVAWDARQIDVVYENLNPKLAYVLAVTYANEAFNDRTQSLWAGSLQLHGPDPLPKGKAERLLFKLPPSTIQDGKLALQFRLEGQVNVVVSAIELWAPAPSPKVLHISDVTGLRSGLDSDLQGRVLDLAYGALGGAAVRLSRAGYSEPLATTRTAADGSFSFKRQVFSEVDRTEELELTAARDGAVGIKSIPVAALYFDPVRYRPIASQVDGLARSGICLDGVWRIDPAPADGARERPLSAPNWSEFRVPGQWVQQGYDLPPNQRVAVATEFTIPTQWAGYRIFLRFDAIHAGTRYWLNGKYLGYSENLFTPVEWDVTDAARYGGQNRLDLEMKVETASEQLSFSSRYAFHNLGGIDRSVRLYALPAVQIRNMRLRTDLDQDYRDGDLKLELTLENAQRQTQSGLSLGILLFGPEGAPVEHSGAESAVGALEPGSRRILATAHVASPLKWNAEQPNLYRLVLELQQGGQTLERIEQQIGFRKIEIRDRQLYINGQRVKLAGACRHETDPLTGRADTMRHAEEDVRLVKGANLNYVRTSHYPPTQELLDAADRLGLYVEVEAPFCWVGDWDMSHLREVLTPTSAMIDYCHAHPSVILWSLANESQFREFFEVSNRLCHDLDPTRPTTFNNPDPKRVCDIANLHYPPMPYDEQVKNEPRPVILGEYFFPICHEQTDVRINPGLRELWAHGHSDPDSDWGRACAANFDNPVFLMPGARPGAWSHIYHSDMLIGGAIWAAFDEPFYLPNGRQVGYAWVHGFWGLVDGWRRPKPEWWLAKLVYSPVWFPRRQVDFAPGQASVRIPVENRYSFTDLRELKFAWTLGQESGEISVELPPSSLGEIEIPLPARAKPGDAIVLRVMDAGGALVNTLAIRLGQRKSEPVPRPRAGLPTWHDDGQIVDIEGKGFRLVLDRSAGDLNASDSRHRAPLTRYPALHISRFDFGDLLAAPPYALLPDEKTRVAEAVVVREGRAGLEITVTDRYDMFRGSVTWLLDSAGVGEVSYDYTYSGDRMYAREVGLKFLLKPECDEIRWRRWSEWDIFPDDHISRTQGSAKARREPQAPDSPESVRPNWPWCLDQTELGTNDFRAGKFNIYEAALVDATAGGLRVRASADVHVRPCLTDGGVKLHVLSQCKLSPVILNKGDHIVGKYVVELLQP